MTAVLVIQGALIVLLTVIVVGLLRSHAEILRRLHELGADAYDDAPDDGRPHARASAADLSLQPHVPRPRAGDAPAANLSGTTPTGATTVIGVLDRPHSTLLAFLSSGCLTCEGFWSAFASGEAGRLPGYDTRLVVVTKGTDAESPAAVAAVSSPNVTTIMSSDAWRDYAVPASPYFILVDGPSGRVIGEGAAATWRQVASLLERACADAGIDPSHPGAPPRARRVDGAAREAHVDDELAAAGIGPDHPSLFGQPVPTEPEPGEP